MWAVLLLLTLIKEARCYYAGRASIHAKCGLGVTLRIACRGLCVIGGESRSCKLEVDFGPLVRVLLSQVLGYFFLVVHGITLLHTPTSRAYCVLSCTP